jgi:branched-chain amino acid transport system substrate-binding protein
LSLTLVAALTAGCGSSGGGQASAETIKLGFLGAKTVNNANYGVPGEKGMKMAVEELNAQGGVLGKQLEGVYEDNKGDAREIANIATKYATVDKVAAMIGDPATGLTKVAAEIAQQNSVVIFSAGATGAGVVEIGDFVFRNTLLDQFAAPSVVEWMLKDKKWTNMAIITTANIGYSTALTPVFKDAIIAQGGKIVREDSINEGETDFTAQVTNLKQVQPDVVVFTGYYKEAALFILEMEKQGIDVPLVGGDGLYGSDLVKIGGDAVNEKIILYCGFSADQPSTETDAFIKAYQAKYNEDPDMFSAQYYDAVMIIAQAMEKAQSADPKVYKTELAQLKNYPGVSGQTTFLPSREPVKSPVFLVTVKDGQFPVLLEKIPTSASE